MPPSRTSILSEPSCSTALVYRSVRWPFPAQPVGTGGVGQTDTGTHHRQDPGQAGAGGGNGGVPVGSVGWNGGRSGGGCGNGCTPDAAWPNLYAGLFAAVLVVWSLPSLLTRYPRVGAAARGRSQQRPPPRSGRRRAAAWSR